MDDSIPTPLPDPSASLPLFRTCKTCTLEKPVADFPPPGKHLAQSVCNACHRLAGHGRRDPSNPAQTARVRPLRAQHPASPTSSGLVFHTVVADPPWPLDLFRKGHEPAYSLLLIPEIIERAPPAAAKSHLYLWVLNQRVDWGYEVAAAWGYEVVQMIAWAKATQGAYPPFHSNTEHFLICRRGGPLNNAFGSTRGTHFEWPRGEHSQKPEAFYNLVEGASPGPYLEMYARRVRDSTQWTAWGNEVPTVPNLDVSAKNIPPEVAARRILSSTAPTPANIVVTVGAEVGVEVKVESSAPVSFRRGMGNEVVIKVT